MRVAKALAALAFLAGGGCTMPPGPAAKQEQIAAIERGSYLVPGSPALRVSFLAAGPANGRRVIFVHGTPGAADGWADFLLNVPQGLRYIAIDRPGFGETRPDHAEPSLRRQAMAIAPLLVLRDGHWPILVGHSLGGPIIARTAADQHGRVGGLLVLAGSLDPALERVHPLQPVGEWWGIRSTLPRRLRNANRELLPLQEQLVALAPHLPKISVPVTIIHGAADRLVPVANVDFMRENLTAARPLAIQTIPDQNHFLPWERRELIEQALRALLVEL